MEYVGIVSRDEKYVGVVFPQAPGCSTFGETYEEMVAMAQDALEGWLESWLVTGDVPPEPKPVTLRKGQQSVVVRVSPRLATAIAIRRARRAANLTQKDLARRLKIAQSGVAKLEQRNSNPSIDTLARVFEATGNVFDISARKRVTSVRSQPAAVAASRKKASGGRR